MATNKHATIRYQALDRCFNNFGRKYFIEDLIEACNEAIYDYTGSVEGVKRRQIFDDIKFMESDQGWSIPLERLKEGRRVYYRYSEKHFSISNKGISTNEAEQLRETLTILSRFTGLPQFEWVREIQIRLENTFKLAGNTDAFISFEQNPYLKGLDYFYTLFQAIQNEQTLNIEYQGYRQNHPSKFVFHPWYLKQYNNRWFLFGLHGKLEVLSNLALDRIVNAVPATNNYIINSKYDFEELFEDVVGVSVNPDGESQKVNLRISNTTWPYIESKPIHGSQKVLELANDHVDIQLDVQINHELIALIFSYMDAVEVLAPSGLRDKIQTLTKLIFDRYN